MLRRDKINEETEDEKMEKIIWEAESITVRKYPRGWGIVQKQEEAESISKAFRAIRRFIKHNTYSDGIGTIYIVDTSDTSAGRRSWEIKKHRVMSIECSKRTRFKWKVTRF